MRSATIVVALVGAGAVLAAPTLEARLSSDPHRT
jgi:hypothetical protein